ncbi:MAG: glycine cleavage system protein GcvH [Methylovirgula sp.]
MSATRFTKEHEYIHVDGDHGTVGITDYAQAQFGDIVFVELPTIGKAIVKGGEAAVVESVKAASELYAPVSGEVVEINTALQETPGLINSDPIGKGWIIKLKLAEPEELDGLMDEAAYNDFVKKLA